MLQLCRNKVSIGEEKIYCNRLGAVILFQCRMNTLRLKWRQCFVGGVMDCPLCGAVEETVANFVTECMVLEGVWEQFGVTWEEALEEILLFRETTEEKVEVHRVVGGGEEEKWTNKCKVLHINSAGT